MTSEDVATLVAWEVEGGTFDNWHGITKANLDDHLVEPRLEDYLDELDNTRVRRYWTILHEVPGGSEGYTIFYSEEDGVFGLAASGGDSRYTSIGLYGTLLETLNAM
jgi:hypothetical protein